MLKMEVLNLEIRINPKFPITEDISNSYKILYWNPFIRQLIIITKLLIRCFFNPKELIFSYFFIKTYVVGTY